VKSNDGKRKQGETMMMMMMMISKQAMAHYYSTAGEYRVV
jgi:hypothetical protein